MVISAPGGTMRLLFSRYVRAWLLLFIMSLWKCSVSRLGSGVLSELFLVERICEEVVGVPRGMLGAVDLPVLEVAISVL